MAHRNRWLVVGGGLFGLIGMLSAGVVGYWQYANYLPTYPAPNVAMPVPNAYDDYVAAGQMCHAAGGAEIPAAPTRLPAPPTPLPAAPLPVPASSPPGNSGGWLGFFAAPPPEAYIGTGGGPGGPPGGPSGRPTSTYRRPVQAYESGVPLTQVRAVVRRNRAALARLRQGFRKQYRCPAVASFMQLIPELGQYRDLGRVLMTEGKLAEREGRSRDAARSYLDCLRFGVEVPRGGLVIHGLVGIYIQEIGLRVLQELSPHLDGATAVAAAREMARLDAGAPGPAETLLAEKETMTASLLEYFRDPGVRHQLEDENAGSILGLLIGFTPKRLMLDNIRGYMDALAASSRRPYHTQLAPSTPNDLLSRRLLPDFDQARFKWALRDAQWRITELRLAIRAYQQAHGMLPHSLDALVPAYLPAVPQDPFAPKPLVYRRKAGRALVYSRGPDGKDDGGMDLNARSYPNSRGDIVSLKWLRM